MTAAGASVAQPLSSATDPGYTRLHIAPFDADLLSVVVPASVRPDARNVSFHGLQTFPEKRYGFVDLPADAAEKLRRKLNGAVLKGVKLRIERARPSALEAMAEQQQQPAENQKTTTPKPKKTKKDKKDKPKRKSLLTEKAQLGGPAGEQLVGVQLEAGRKVQRGWTQTAAEKAAAGAVLARAKMEEKREKREKKEKKRKEKEANDNDNDIDHGHDHDARKKRRQDKDKKAQPRLRSKYTDEPECLIKTVLPAHKVVATATAKTDEAAGDPEPKERRKRKAREVVVHEFAHTTKFPTFLKSSAGAADAPRKGLAFVDGTGWVDGDGAVVQPLQVTRPARVAAGMDAATLAQARAARAARGEAEEDTDTSSSESGSESDGDSDSDSESESESESVSEHADSSTSRARKAASPPRPKSAGSAKGLTIQIPPPPTPTAVPSTPAPAKDKKTVHPLEALYKRPAAAAGDDDDVADVVATPKATTKTAAASKDAGGGGFRFFGGDMDVDEEEEEDDDDDGEEGAAAQSLQPPMTPYTKQDLDWRHQRSAAPTPDTAHPSRARSFDWPAVDGEDTIEEGGEEEDAAEEAAEDADNDNDNPKDFQSWFWDNRGELNRSWKRRRKTAAKEKRYRENRARAERAI